MTTWRQRFKAARKRGYFQYDDMSAAGQWNNCAVGETHKNVGKIFFDNWYWTYKYEGPKELAKIWELGTEFAGYVRDNNFDAAEKTFFEIEKMNGELDKAVERFNKK
jgi:hypothetical protein